MERNQLSYTLDLLIVYTAYTNIDHASDINQYLTSANYITDYFIKY